MTADRIDRASVVEAAIRAYRDAIVRTEAWSHSGGGDDISVMQEESRAHDALLAAVRALSPAPAWTEEALAGAIKKALMAEAGPRSFWHPWVAGPAAKIAARIALRGPGGGR